MDGIVLPDIATLSSKEVKKKKQEIDKIYKPFLSKFFGNKGVVPQTLNSIKDILNLRFLGFENLLDEQLINQEKERKARERREPTKEEENQEKKSKKKWFRILFQNKFFDSALGFLRRMATTSFLSELLALFVLLKLGFLQPLIKMVADMVGDIVQSLFKMIPTLLKFFWHILWDFLPKILTNVFNTILDTIGFRNKFTEGIFGGLAKILPLLVFLATAFSKLRPVFTFLATVFSKLQPVFTFLATVFSKLRLVFTFLATVFSKLRLVFTFLAKTWPFILKGLMIIGKGIAAVISGIGAIPILIGLAIAAVGLAIWYFWDEIVAGFNFTIEWVKSAWTGLITWIGSVWDTFLYQTLPAVWDTIIEFFFGILDLFLKPIRKVFQMLARLFSPILNMLKSTMDTLKPLFEKIGDILKPIREFFSMLGEFISRIVKMITTTFRDVMGPIFEWIDNIATYGLKWFRMSDKEKESIQSTQKAFRGSDQADILQRYVTASTDGEKEKILQEVEAGKREEFVKLAREISSARKEDESVLQTAGRLKAQNKLPQFENVLSFKVASSTASRS